MVHVTGSDGDWSRECRALIIADFGALAGWIASLRVRRNQEMDWLENLVVGIVGALVGGFLFSLLADTAWESGFNIGTLLVAILGAVIVLAIWNVIRSRSSNDA